jgi:crotonobetainyl-CoA:carnitine CoA-transferase CaiB-like acyl-CoA transferase
MPGPLSSLKILDFSTLLPGPFASMTLADMGAEVLRVEAPHRPDMVRLMQPFDEEGNSSWHALLNRSKRSLALDLKKPGATEVIKRLVSEGGYDIVLEQFRPGVMERLGIDYKALAAVNSRLIYCAITGYGQTGPYKDRAGHDLNYLALAGVMSHTGRKESGPMPPGVQVADVGGGSLGAVTGILAAVIERQVTGQGQMVDISMFDMAIAWHSHVVSAYLVGGRVPDYESWGLNGGGFYDCYETKDGRYLSVGSLEPQFWQGFCTAIGRTDLIKWGFAAVPGQMADLKAEIAAVIKERTLAEWTAVFAKYDVCVEPVLTVPEMLEHPQTQARGMIVEVMQTNGRSQQQIASPYKFSRSQPAYKHTGMKPGTHSEEVLRELGYWEEEITLLRGEGVLG